jgi:PKD domain/Cysteine-rich secretory protein family
MAQYFVSPQGNDQNSGTSEGQAFKTLGPSTRLKPGDTLIALPGTITGTFNSPSGTSAAPITFKAKSPGETTIDGSVRVDGLTWSKISKGYQTPYSRTVFGVFQRDYSTDGKRAQFNDRAFNQYGSNPEYDLHGTPAEFKWEGGNLRLNAIPSTPSAEPLHAAVTEMALDLNGRSHINVEGIVTRGHKHAIATNGGTGIHFQGCRFTFCSSTSVWLVGLADASMVNCIIQGGGSWSGHYEDCCHTERVSNLRLESVEMSYGGHSGLIMLTGAPTPGKIILRKCYWYAMGGSLLTLKRNVDNLVVEDCWFADAAKSTEVDAHKVPHAGIQLSGKGHKFTNCVFANSGKAILASSDGNADSNPVCSDSLFDHCTFSNTEAAVVEIQEYAPNGQVARNRFRDCILQAVVGPERDATLSCWYSGQSKPTAGRSNVWEHCQIVGNIRGSQGSFSNVEAARGAEPSVYVGSSSSPISGTGSSMTEPPSSGASPEPPDPTEPPITPPTTERPVLRALVPISGPPGVRVTATGVNFGTGPEVLVPVPDGARRLSPPGGTDTEVSWNMPPDVVTGEVRVRNGSVLSNPLTFTRTGSTPPTNKPPVANAGGPYSGTVGQPVLFDGSGSTDPDGTIVNYEWGFGDGPSNYSAMKLPHTFTAPDTYIVTLTVRDNQGATSAVQTTATIAAAPAGELVVSLTAVPSGKAATFSGTASERPVTITVTARTPDGRQASAEAYVDGDVQPPAGDLPAEVIELVRLHNEIRAGRALPKEKKKDVEHGDIDEPWMWTSPRAIAAAAAPPLVAHPQLMQSAKAYAVRMEGEGFFSHTSPDGSTPFTRMAAAGYRGSTMGENLAKGFSNSLSVMQAWMNSSGHRANIENAAYRDIGAWFVASSGLWVVNFGGG